MENTEKTNTSTKTLWITIALLLSISAYQTWRLQQLGEKVQIAQADISNPPVATKKNFSFPSKLSDRRDPFLETEKMAQEMDRIMEEAFAWRPGFDMPSMGEQIKVKDEQDHYEVFVHLPKAEEASTDFKVRDGVLMLTVSTERTSESSNENDSFGFFRHQSQRSWTRSIPLPEPIEEDQISTRLEKDGITLVIPKKNT